VAEVTRESGGRPFHRTKLFWLVSGATWILTALVPAIQLYKGEVQIGWLPVYTAYILLVDQPHHPQPWTFVAVHLVLSFSTGVLAAYLWRMLRRKRS
jgi:hypothetical protein